MMSTRDTAVPFSLFRYGFRPFFLLTGLLAAVIVPAWLVIYESGVVPLRGLPPQYWHGHEMIFGFVVAAIAGFLLTSVPAWTGVRGFAGARLVALASIWVLGRLALGWGGALPAWVPVVVELAFLPALAWLIGPPLLRARNRNTPLLGVIAALWVCDALFMRAEVTHDPLLALHVLYAAIDIILTLITVIGGRIIPTFTANALRRRGRPYDIAPRSWLERTVVGAMIAVIIVDAVYPAGTLAGALAALVAILQAARLAEWKGLRTLDDPILWVLHVGYAWLPIGFALKALALLGGVGWAGYWLHALTMGVFGTMILGVMTRVALGHTGRALRVAKAIVLAYLALTLGVLVRVFAPALWPAGYLRVLEIAGALWTVAFVLYLAVYVPILVRPRVDGKPG